MTTYLRSDVSEVQAAHLHKKKASEPHLVLNCAECEEHIRRQPGLWADRPSLVPMTPEEEREEDEIKRDVALANAVHGRAIRDEQTAKVRASRTRKS